MAWVLVLALGGGYLALLRRGSGPSARQRLAFGAGLLLLYVFLDWPVSDLGQRSLLVHMARQTVFLLAVPPLLLGGLPRWASDEVRDRAGAPGAVRLVLSPVTASIVFNAAVVVSCLPVVMDAGVRNPAIGAALDVGLLAAGLVMWTPALRAFSPPGGLRRGGRAAYLMVQSVVPSFASLVFIFDRNPIYAVFRRAPRTIGISPLVDQQLAGALAKVAGLAILLGAAGAILLRGGDSEEEELVPGTLTWDDVERELRRIDRRERRDSHPGP